MTEAAATEIEEIIHAWVAAYNIQDMTAFLPYYRPDASVFWPDEGELVVAEGVHERYQAGAETDGKMNLQAHDIDVQDHGDIALATCYFRGTFNPPDGTMVNIAFRVSLVWSNAGGQWQIVHAHYSPRKLDT